MYTSSNNAKGSNMTHTPAENNTKLQVLLSEHGNNISDGIHYKAATSYAIRITNERVRWIGGGKPSFAPIEVAHSGHVVAKFNAYHPPIMQGVDGDVYAALRYMQTALENERREIKKWGDEFLTVEEVENDLDLITGAAMTKIAGKIEQLARAGNIRYENGDLLIKRGYALNVWQTNRANPGTLEVTNEFAAIVNHDALQNEAARYGTPIKQEVYNKLISTMWQGMLYQYQDVYLFRNDPTTPRTEFLRMAKWLKNHTA